MLKELAVVRFSFGCPHCGHSWTRDYDVQHVENGHGQAWDYYALNGSPVTAPTAPGVVRCPACGAHRVHVEIVASRNIPLAEPPTAEGPSAHAQPVTPEQHARRNAPLLAGEHNDPPAGGQPPAVPEDTPDAAQPGSADETRSSDVILLG